MSGQDFFSVLEKCRTRKPLVQNITNFVAMELSANVLLTVGASPAMVHSLSEVRDFVKIASSLVINIGTLSPSWVESMVAAAEVASLLKKPWVLDPVGAGATPFRTDVALSLMDLNPTLIRGNAGEIAALAGDVSKVRGVDSVGETPFDVAVSLARKTGSLVAMTGEIDFLTDGAHSLEISGGDVLMTRVTAVGCSLSALCGAFLAVENSFQGAAASLSLYKLAGEKAALQTKGLVGGFGGALCDALYTLSREDCIRQYG